MILANWADIDVAKRPARQRIQKPAFDGDRQAKALSELQEAAGIDATVAAQLVGLSYPQYNRYLWGRVPLRTDQFRAFAEAYGVTRAALARALGLMDDEVDPVLEARLAGVLGACSTPEMARFAAREIGKLPPADQEKVLSDLSAQDHRHD